MLLWKIVCQCPSKFSKEARSIKRQFGNLGIQSRFRRLCTELPTPPPDQTQTQPHLTTKDSLLSAVSSNGIAGGIVFPSNFPANLAATTLLWWHVYRTKAPFTISITALIWQTSSSGVLSSAGLEARMFVSLTRGRGPMDRSLVCEAVGYATHEARDCFTSSFSISQCLQLWQASSASSSFSSSGIG